MGKRQKLVFQNCSQVSEHSLTSWGTKVSQQAIFFQIVHWVGSKPRHLDWCDSIWRVKSGRFGAWQEIFRPKNHIFSCQDTPARKILTFFSPTTPGKELVHFGENLYILATQDWLLGGKIWSNSSPMCPREKNFFELFLANNPPTRLELNFFSSGSCTATNKPPRLS